MIRERLAQDNDLKMLLGIADSLGMAWHFGNPLALASEEVFFDRTSQTENGGTSVQMYVHAYMV